MKAITIGAGLLGLALFCACEGPGIVGGRVDAGPPCEQMGTAETTCSGGVDEDCDMYTDCLDTECEGQTCGADGLVCMSGACRRPCDPTQGSCWNTQPAMQNLRVTMRGDTAVIEFEPVEGALDYRIYPEPAESELLVGADGEVSVRNGIYRCAGDRPMVLRDTDPSSFYHLSLTSAENVGGYVRTEAEAILGYVYLTPGEGRDPVYRVADPNANGGYTNSSWNVPPGIDFNAADYVLGTDARDRLLAMGWRDDGIAFYVPRDGTRPISRVDYTFFGGNAVFFVPPGAEADHFASGSSEPVERFRVHEAATDGAVPLYRVFYLEGHAHDVLAPGNERFQRVLHQGNRPVTSLSWPGLPRATTLVIEALDAGCPFPGHLGPTHVEAAEGEGREDYPVLTIDEARLPTGEIFINGQHDPGNRPRVLARSFVTVTPVPHPAMDWYESFEPGTWEEPEVLVEDGIFTQVMRSARFGVELWGGQTRNQFMAPFLNQLATASATGGELHIIPRDIQPEMASDRFVHLHMAADIPSTWRRYPQMIITTARLAERDEFLTYQMPISTRYGNTPNNAFPWASPEKTLIVQPFGPNHELTVEFCDRRGWGVSQQCDRANIYGHHAGDYTAEWEQPWQAVPVMGEYAGIDRLVHFDVYASSQRVYVFVEDRPMGCAVFPSGNGPEGPVTVLFGTVGYHIEIDEPVVGEASVNHYFRDYSLWQIDRHLDDLGIDLSVPAPPWDETTLPCATRWYGGVNE